MSPPTHPVSTGTKNAKPAPTGTSQPRMAPPLAAPPSVVPPPSVPLTFLLLGGIGLVAFGLAVWFAADHAVVAPTYPGVVSAVHVGVLAFLTVSVLGAMHQFAPVVSRRPLRSVWVARASLVGLVIGAWMLPSGFAHGPESFVTVGGLVAATGVALAVWNLSGPLSARGGGVPLNGLRLSTTFLVITVAFGVVYALDRQAGWFPLYSHRVLAHAHLGLLGWLGLTYIAVAEKLWPMFLLSHRPRATSGAWAVGLVASGTAVLAPGLLFAWPVVAWVGGLVAAAGLIAHLFSLYESIRHRRRALELLHCFLIASAVMLTAALVIAAVAAAAPVSTVTRNRLVAAEVAALLGWLGLAVAGHAHKIVPFISYTRLRARGIERSPEGRPMLFEDLADRRLGWCALVLIAAAFVAGVPALLIGSAGLLAAGGAALAVGGLVATVNLTSGPLRAARRFAPVASKPPERSAVEAALRDVWDPELGIDVLSLGLVYDIRTTDGRVDIDMTLTTPGCPVSEQLPGEAEAAVRRAVPASDVQVNLVWEPPWTPDRLSSEAADALGFPR